MQHNTMARLVIRGIRVVGLVFAAGVICFGAGRGAQAASAGLPAQASVVRNVIDCSTQPQTQAQTQTQTQTPCRNVAAPTAEMDQASRSVGVVKIGADWFDMGTEPVILE